MKKYKIFISCDSEESIIIYAKIYKIDEKRIIFINSNYYVVAIFNLDYIVGIMEVEDESEN